MPETLLFGRRSRVCVGMDCATIPVMENEQNITPAAQADQQAATREPSSPAESVAPGQASVSAEPPAPTVDSPEETPASFDVFLASASPRRKQLLEDAGIAFAVRVSAADEALDADQLADPPEAAKKLAERKAGAVVQEILAEDYTGMAIVLGADTMVVCDGDIFGKPKSLSDATRMLRRLSGTTHEVLTAVSVWMVAAPEPEKISLGFRTLVDATAVTFRTLSDDEIAEYLRQGESFDKAGAYAIQGAGAALVERIDGALDTVIGLPVERLLREFPDLAAAKA